MPRIPVRWFPFALAGGLCACALGGCTLMDQRTFDPAAGQPAKIIQPPGPAAPTALVVIDFAKPNPDYTEALDQAVESALARKPDVRFEVATVVPATGTAADQAGAAESLTPDARQVARDIAEAGVSDESIELTARSSPQATSRQLQVCVH